MRQESLKSCGRIAMDHRNSNRDLVRTPRPLHRSQLGSLWTIRGQREGPFVRMSRDQIPLALMTMARVGPLM